VGEEWSGNPVIVSYWLRGKVNHDGYVSHMPSMMDYPLHDMLRKALVTKETMHTGFNELYEAMRGDALYPDPMNLVLFEGNHDVSRLYSALDEDFGLYKMAIAYLLTMRGIPQFYYGTEILMTSPKHRHDGEFRRNFPGGWAGDKVNAATGVGLTAQQKEAQAYLKKLLNWRKSQPVIHSGKLMHYAPLQGMYVYFRHDDNKKVMVVMNKNTSDTALATGRFHEMLNTHASGTDVISGRTFDLRRELTVPARSALILEVQ
jgi:glycosidase